MTHPAHIREAVRQRYAAGVSRKDLVEQFGLTLQSLHSIVRDMPTTGRPGKVPPPPKPARPPVTPRHAPGCPPRAGK